MGRSPLVAAPQTATTSWKDFGNEIGVKTIEEIGLFWKVVKGNSTGFTLRMLSRHTEAGDNFPYPMIDTTTTGYSIIQNHYFSMADTTTNYFYTWPIDQVVTNVQFQIACSTTGAAVGTFDAVYSTKNRSR